MRVLARIVVLVVAVALAVFAVSNRENVALGLWPLPSLVELPLYLVILAALVLGFVAGELVAWIASRHWRREVRISRRRVAALERELAATQARLADPPPRAAALPRDLG